jgi:hypothetical protein
MWNISNLNTKWPQNKKQGSLFLIKYKQQKLHQVI